MNTQELQDTIVKLQAQVNDLSSAFYKNNFTSSQSFTKAITFGDSVKLPVYTTLPNCEAGQICVYSTGGTYKLMVATATNTWTIVGTQV